MVHMCEGDRKELVSCMTRSGHTLALVVLFGEAALRYAASLLVEALGARHVRGARGRAGRRRRRSSWSWCPRRAAALVARPHASLPVGGIARPTASVHGALQRTGAPVTVRQMRSTAYDQIGPASRAIPGIRPSNARRSSSRSSAHVDGWGQAACCASTRKQTWRLRPRRDRRCMRVQGKSACEVVN
jgi:hypothetical protein